MPNHRTRQLAACVAVLMLVGLDPATVAGASPRLTPAQAAQLDNWYKQDAAPLVTAVSNAATDFTNQKYMLACSSEGHAATVALTKPNPPIASIAYHWGAAVAFYIAGAGECVVAIEHNDNATQLTNAATYLDDGNTQFGDVTTAIKALT
jgi:hypothetical protein